MLLSGIIAARAIITASKPGYRFWLYRDGLYERESDKPRWFMHGCHERGGVCRAGGNQFQFLHGTSHPQKMVETAAFSYRAIGLADRNTLAGVVRGRAAAKGCAGGARLVTQCGLR